MQSVVTASSVLINVFCLSSFFFHRQSKAKGKKSDETVEEVVEEQAVGTIAVVKEVVGRTGSRGGVTQVRHHLVNYFECFLYSMNRLL